MADSALLQALILGIVEGLTEFLPISSTGHLIVASDLIGATGERWNVFNIAIQTGAMLAVVWEYRARFFKVDVLLYRNLIVAFVARLRDRCRRVAARADRRGRDTSTRARARGRA